MRTRSVAVAAAALMFTGIVFQTAAAVVAQQTQRVQRAIIENPPGSKEIFTCGVDHKLPYPIPLRPTTLILAGDSRLYVPCPFLAVHTFEDREVREAAVLGSGLRSAEPELRWRAAQALARMPKFRAFEAVLLSRTEVSPGRFKVEGMSTALEDNLGDLVKLPAFTPVCGPVQVFGGIADPLRWMPGRLFHLLTDPAPDVQKEAAYAIGTRLLNPGRPPDLYTAAFNEIRSCLLRTPAQMNDEVRGLLLEAVGLASYTTDEQRAAAEAFLVDQSQGSIEKVLGATRGLESLIRRNPRRAIQTTTRTRLREIATSGQRGQLSAFDPAATSRALAVAGLMASGETDLATIQRAARDDDWQVRRLVAGRLDLAVEGHAALAEMLSNDPAFQVRYDLLSAVGRLATRTSKCEPVAAYFKDSSPLVAMRAMDVLPATCTDLASAIEQLTAAADLLQTGSGQGDDQWHASARALVALARLKPEEAASRLETAVKHDVWQVRATAAAVAATLRDEPKAESLARDSHPNVQTAALDALLRMKSASVVPLAISTLQDATDFQLLMTAARVLRGLPAEAKDAATEALLGALRKLTDQANDMSRDPRVAILDRLAETLPAARSTDLATYALDFDDEVANAAIRSFTALIGSPPPDRGKRRRYPAQPLEQQLRTLPTTAVIELDTGAVQLRLLTDVAPVTVARFAELAAKRAYDGKTLHRVVPNFVVQGGSPGANEYAGAADRFMRDEVGPQARHIRGAVGISTRGLDTGDGQFFIDLVDVPRLDRAYTVFAYVTSGMEYVDRMLEGARIRSIVLR